MVPGHIPRALLGLIVGLILFESGCQSRHDAPTIKQSVRHKVFEGLPHQEYEPEVLKAELSKPTVESGGFAFYRDPLDVSDSDIAALVAILGTTSTYESFSGEKKCGGFHPDFAVEWTLQGTPYRTLICFGCGEIKVEGHGGETRYDVARDARKRLMAILKPYRKNRPLPLTGPPTEAF